MKKVTFAAVGKAFLASSPSLTGSLARLPFGPNIGRTGGKQWTAIFLILCILGITLNMILAFTQDVDDAGKYIMDSFAGRYWLWIVGGWLSGFGIATFPMIINVALWSTLAEGGVKQALYGGLANCTPGAFALLMPFVMEAFNLKIAYVIWLILTIIGSFGALAFIVNTPYHQLKDAGVNEADAKKVARWLGQQQVPKPGASLGDVIGMFKAWVLVFNYFLCFGGFLALTTYLPILEKDYNNQSPRMAGVFTATFSIFASISRSIMGKTTDKIGGGKAAMIGGICVAVGTVAFGFTPPDAPLHILHLTGLYLTAFGMGFVNAATYKWIPKALPGLEAPTGGMVGGLGAFGGFVLPLLLGYCGENWGERGYAYGMFFYTGIAFFNIFMTFMLESHLRANPPVFSALGVPQTPMEGEGFKKKDGGDNAV